MSSAGKKTPPPGPATWGRRLFLASQPFVIHTNLPYDESVTRLLHIRNMGSYTLTRELQADGKSALFEIRLVHYGGRPRHEYITSKQPRHVVVAIGRIVAQPALNDTVISGEVFNNWLKTLAAVFVIGTSACLTIVIALLLPLILSNPSNGVFNILAILMLFATFTIVGVTRLTTDLPRRRQQLVHDLEALYEHSPPS